MSLTAEQREQVATELKRFAGDLNLTDEKKEKLQAALGGRPRKDRRVPQEQPQRNQSRYHRQGEGASRRDSSTRC